MKFEFHVSIDAPDPKRELCRWLPTAEHLNGLRDLYAKGLKKKLAEMVEHPCVWTVRDLSGEGLETVIEPTRELQESRRPPAESLERTPQFHIDARRTEIHQPQEKVKYATCGDCGQRYEMSSDPIENHNRAMRHKEACKKQGMRYTPQEYDRLKAEFDAQPNIVAMRERLQAGLPVLPTAAELEGGPRLLAAAAPAKRTAHWWEFWRWFE